MSLAAITVDLTALRHNLQQIKKIVAGRAVLAVIKANAYGHDIRQVATTLSQADAFGVTSLAEACFLRDIGVKQPIVLMSGILDREELATAIAKQLDIVIHHPAQIEMLQQAMHPGAVRVWFKINTGMNRLGFSPEQVPQAYAALTRCASVKKPPILMTHLAKADELASPLTQQQLHRFQTLTAALPGPHSIANSAAILAHPKAHADWVRPGLALYGVSPLPNTLGKDYGLRPVMCLSTRLIAVQPVKKGECIGYGGTWIASQDMRVGVAGLGYADGYPQFAQNGTPVAVKGTQCPLVGRVSMNMVTVDLSQHPDPRVGDPVLFWGKELPIEIVSKHCCTSAYELLCRVNGGARAKTKS